MKCTDQTIKDLLPVYLEQALDQSEQDRVQKHLEGCEDCRSELSLLRMMSEEPVPDPGEAFWASMPGRVYRGVADSRDKNKGAFDLTWLWGRFILPRWTWAAAAVSIVLVLSWVVLRSPQRTPVQSLSQNDEASVETMAADASDPDTLTLRDLDREDLNTVDTWAGKELASITQDVDQAMVFSPDTDINEELAELNAAEMEQLSTRLTQGIQEG
jgi:anti-sigma factor RsiW